MVTTPVFLPGKSHGQSSLAGYSPRGHKRVRHALETNHQHRGCEVGLPNVVAGIATHVCEPEHFPAGLFLDSAYLSKTLTAPLHREGSRGSERDCEP